MNEGNSMLEKARALEAVFSAQAPVNEAQGRLSEPTMQALRSGDFFTLIAPRCLGGAESSAVQALEVVEALCAADGSTGWVVMAASLAIAAAGVYLEDSAVQTLFGGGRVPVIAGHGGPNGKAIAEAGGFRLSGAWRYGSGVLNADYLHSGAVIYDGDKPRMGPNGQPETRIFITRPQDAVFKGGWDVLGLRGTGSVDYDMNGVHVPEAFTHRQYLAQPRRGGNFYVIGMLGFALIGHTGFALGVGRRALDEIARYARGHESPAGALRASERFHSAYATAEAHYRAARALVYETWRDIDAATARGEAMSTRQITLARLALRHVTDMAANAAEFGYREGGGYALRDSPIQRCFRDVHAGTQHLHTSSRVFQECGRELAGMAQGEQWGRFGLAANAA
jgi:alkylation response protein AidB-like acyl-CoA dehydrogenase